MGETTIYNFLPNTEEVRGIQKNSDDKCIRVLRTKQEIYAEIKKRYDQFDIGTINKKGNSFYISMPFWGKTVINFTEKDGYYGMFCALYAEYKLKRKTVNRKYLKPCAKEIGILTSVALLGAILGNLLGNSFEITPNDILDNMEKEFNSQNKISAPAVPGKVKK